jgi:hypothetical protein
VLRPRGWRQQEREGPAAWRRAAEGLAEG